MQIKGIRDLYGKSGIDSTNEFELRKFTERMKVNTSNAGIRDKKNIKIILDEAKKLSNGPRVTPAGVDKLLEDLKRGSTKRKIEELGLTNVGEKDIKELRKILTYEEPEEPEQEEKTKKAEETEEE